MPVALVTQLSMDPQGAIAALEILVDGLDLAGQLCVLAPARAGAVPVRIKGGTGDLHSSHARWTLRCWNFSSSMNG